MISPQTILKKVKNLDFCHGASMQREISQLIDMFITWCEEQSEESIKETGLIISVWKKSPVVKTDGIVEYDVWSIFATLFCDKNEDSLLRILIQSMFKQRFGVQLLLEAKLEKVSRFLEDKKQGRIDSHKSSHVVERQKRGTICNPYRSVSSSKGDVRAPSVERAEQDRSDTLSFSDMFN